MKRLFERGDKSRLRAQTRSPKSVLLVQCCHLPQFFYLAKKLRERNPEWILSALVTDRPQVRFYLELFPPFDHLFFFDKKLPEMPGAFDQVLFPLLNRGYLRIKRAARRLPGAAYEIDYQGDRRALSLGTWENLKTVLALARSRVEVVSSIFSPQPVFRLQKLLFVLLPARHRLAFNQEDLNCYYLKGRHGRSGQPSVWGTLLRVLLTRSRRGVRPTLFFPTAEDSKAVEAIQRLQDPKIAAKSIVVFCREDKRSLYQDLPTVEAVWTYAPGSSLRHLRTWVRLLRTRVDLVCAIFTGQPIFRLQKFLFLTLRARNRLVFNEDLNCYMLRGNLGQFLQPQGGHRGLDHSALKLVVRKVLKGFLFVPRFLYLILWAAVATMRARRRISQESRRANRRSQKTSLALATLTTR